MLTFWHPAATIVVRGAAANVLGKIWVAAAQLMSIPVLTATWGPEGFGAWLMLSTIPAYLALSDIGLGSAASTEMTRRLAVGDQIGALAVFQSVWVFLTMASGGIAMAMLLVGSFAIVPRMDFSQDEVLAALAALCVYAALIVQMSVFFTAYHATRRFAAGTLIADLAIPLEACAVMFIAVIGGGIGAAAIALVVVRLPLTVLFYRRITQAEPWLGVGVRHASFAAVRHLIPPSMATLALSAANVALLQGVVLALGATAGAAAAAVYASARTLTRIPVQLAGAVSRASVPELTRAKAGADARLSRRLGNGVVLVAVMVTLPCCVALSIWGPDFLALLSGGQLDAGVTLFVLLSGAALANSVSSALASPIIASNRHGQFAYIYFAAGIVATLGALSLGGETATIAASLVLAAETAGLMAVLFARRNQP